MKSQGLHVQAGFSKRRAGLHKLEVVQRCTKVTANQCVSVTALRSFGRSFAKGVSQQYGDDTLIQQALQSKSSPSLKSAVLEPWFERQNGRLGMRSHLVPQNNIISIIVLIGSFQTPCVYCFKEIFDVLRKRYCTLGATDTEAQRMSPWPLARLAVMYKQYYQVPLTSHYTSSRCTIIPLHRHSDVLSSHYSVFLL